MMEVVVAYDIANDDRRARVAALLSRSGVRMQRSVFQCRVPKGGMEDLLDQVRSLIDERTDTVHAFRQCSECRGHAAEMGQAPPDLDVRYWVV